MAAERVAVAIAMGDVPAGAMGDAFATLRMLNRCAEIEREASALRSFRSGLPVWSFPAVAPWVGF